MNLPILVNHDYSKPPIGKAEMENGKVVIKLRPEAGVTVDQLVKLNIGYIPTRLEGEVVVEAELIELSIAVKNDSSA